MAQILIKELVDFVFLRTIFDKFDSDVAALRVLGKYNTRLRRFSGYYKGYH